MPHPGFDEGGLELFVIAVLHVPQHERREAVLLLQALDGVCVHAAGGNQDQPAGLSRVLLHIDLRDHTAAACAHKNGLFHAQLFEKGVHSHHKRLIGGQLLGIVKQKHLIVLGQVVHIVHPHFQRVHAAVQEHERPSPVIAAQDVAEYRAVHRHGLAGIFFRKIIYFLRI